MGNCSTAHIDSSVECFWSIFGSIFFKRSEQQAVAQAITQAITLENAGENRFRKRSLFTFYCTTVQTCFAVTTYLHKCEKSRELSQRKENPQRES